MTTATLADIITKIRRLTGSANSFQLKDSEIVDYINSFYLYDFPAELRTLHLKNTFTFNTIKNVDTYSFDFKHYTSLEAPAYVDKKLVPLYQSPWPFYSLFFNWQQREVLGTGTDSAGPYSFTVMDTPIIRSVHNNPLTATQTVPTGSFATGSYPANFSEPNPSRVQNILITAQSNTGTEHITDDGDDNLIGATGVSGTVDYDTGSITGLTFANPIPSGNDITIAYNPANPAIPQAVLFWQNNITLRPVPDQGYTVEIVAYRRPSQVLLGTENPEIPKTEGLPELLEWWETIAAGAAKKIFEDRQDPDGIMMMDKMLDERYALNETRTYAQLGKQRIATIYSDQLDGTSSGFLPFGGNGS
jgi:hypothetical protein